MKLALLDRGRDAGATTLRLVLSFSLVLASAGAGAIVVSTQALAAPPDKIDICHATGADTNPYVLNSPDKSADVGGHNGHTGGLYAPGAVAWGDIIPSFSYPASGGTPAGTYPGQNYSGTGLLIYQNGCDLPPDLRIGKTGPDTALVGDTGSYVLTVSNAGAGQGNATITVQDDVPTGWSVVSVTPQPGRGFTCSTAGQRITCVTDNDLSVGSTLTLTVVVRYDTAGLKTNTASVASPVDSDPGNNTATKATTVAPRPAPDLTLAKSAPASVVVGGAGTYTLTATNSGNLVTTGTITVTDALPAGVAAGTVPTGCSLTGSTVTCTSTSPLAPTSTVSFAIPVTFTSVGSIVNSASVGGGGELDTTNNSATATTAVAGIPDLTLAKTAPANAVVGDPGSYVLTVTNAGSAPTSGTITVSDPLPAGVTAGTMPAGCVLTGTTVTCTSADPLAPTASVGFTIPVTFATSGSKVNQAAVSGGGEVDTGNNAASATTSVTAAAVPDLTLSKTAPASAVVGDPGSYVLTVTNSAGVASTSGTITVTDTLPAGVTAGTLPAGCALSGGTVTCSTTSGLAPAATVSFVIPVTFTAVGSIVNDAAVSGGGEANTGNNGATATTQVAGIPDLTLDKTAPSSALVGGSGSYVLTVTNTGNGTTAGTITVTDTLPAAVTAGTLPAGCALSGATVTCTSAGPLAPAASLAFTVPVTFTAAGVITNSALVGGGGESNTTNNTATASTTVTAAPVPDLALTKAAPATATTGDGGTYTLTVDNVGTAAATAQIVVTDTLPAGVTVAPAASGGFVCTVSAGVVTCSTDDDIAVGASKVILLPAVFTTQGVKANTASVATAGDRNAANDSSTATTRVTDPFLPPPPPPAQADLAVQKSGPASIRPGDTIVWTLTVTNKGPGNASGFAVTDALPAGVSLTSLLGPSFTCTTSTLVCTFTGVLLPGQTAAVTVVGAVADDVQGASLTNVVVVGPSDSTPADNTDTLVTGIDRPTPLPAPADLVLAKSGPALAVAGEQVTWTIAVTNAGGQDATGFAVSDPLAAGVSLVQGAGDGFACGSAVPLVCTYTGALAPGAVATLVVTGLVAADTPATSVTNTASAPLAGDPTPENNTDSATTAVAVPIGGVDEQPATGSETPPASPTTPAPSAAPAATPVAPARSAVPDQARPASLPFTGSSADSLLALGGAVSLLGLLIALTGRRRRTA